MSEMNTLEVTIKMKVPASSVSTFAKLLVSRMHKYLTKHSATVYKVDTKIYKE